MIEFTLEYKGEKNFVSALGFLDAIGRNFPGACGAKRTRVISMSQKERWSIDFGYKAERILVTITRSDFNG